MIPQKQTLCWSCGHAVPDGGEKGCSWSRSGIPVPGWDAEEHYMKGTTWHDRHYDFISYKVIQCPEYIPDKEVRHEHPGY